jgi:hypothetical protein
MACSHHDASIVQVQTSVPILTQVMTACPILCRGMSALAANGIACDGEEGISTLPHRLAGGLAASAARALQF